MICRTRLVTVLTICMCCGLVASRIGTGQSETTAEPRQRFSPEERERQIVDGAIKFFSDRGLDGQTRELAIQIGVTHPLLYHYFPSKRSLIERVYQEVYLGRWKRAWEELLGDHLTPFPDRLSAFYIDYANTILTKEWVRILVFSGLSDGYIPDKYIGLLKERLYPRIIRETRKHLNIRDETGADERESELIQGLHGGIFYIGIRHWVYGQPMPQDLPGIIKDRVRSYLLAAPETFYRRT